MKNNKKEFKEKSKKLIDKEKKAEPKKAYIESVPRFNIGDLVAYFMETSTKVEFGEVVGIFIQPGQEKDYVYQIEYEFKDDKKKKHKGLCVPRSENVCYKSSEKEIAKLEKKLKKVNVKKLKNEVKEYKDSLKIADDNIKSQNDYKKQTLVIIKSLEKRISDILNSSK